MCQIIDQGQPRRFTPPSLTNPLPQVVLLSWSVTEGILLSSIRSNKAVISRASWSLSADKQLGGSRP
jgi:hypothetical protein